MLPAIRPATVARTELAQLVDGALDVPRARDGAAVRRRSGRRPIAACAPSCSTARACGRRVRGRRELSRLHRRRRLAARFHRNLRLSLPRLAAAAVGVSAPTRRGRTAKLSVATVDAAPVRVYRRRQGSAPGRPALQARRARVGARRGEPRAHRRGPAGGAAHAGAARAVAPRPPRRHSTASSSALLRLSYESEIRIVEPTKVAALFAAEREHYRAVARRARRRARRARRRRALGARRYRRARSRRTRSCRGGCVARAVARSCGCRSTSSRTTAGSTICSRSWNASVSRWR